MQPWWDETTQILVTAEELNAEEKLRIQLWDSDRSLADEDLGRIEVDLKEIMRGEKTNGKIEERVDGFKALEANKRMPGKLDWSLGYYSKLPVQESQLEQQNEDSEVKNIKQLQEKSYRESERKLREAGKDKSSELEQQKKQDLDAREKSLIAAAPPPQDYPSGILSIQIHQITGLEIEKQSKEQGSKDEDASDEDESGDDLPSSYCTIIVNHQKIFKTRTKPKNSKPFFNAGTERFIRDWRNTEIMLSVRDNRVHEDDPLLGIVYLPWQRSSLDAARRTTSTPWLVVSDTAG